MFERWGAKRDVPEPWSIRRGWCPLCLFTLELDLSHLTRCVMENAVWIKFSTGIELRFPYRRQVSGGS